MRSLPVSNVGAAALIPLVFAAARSPAWAQTEAGGLPAPAPAPVVVPAPRPILVTVNGDPVVFAGQSPVEQEGTILVPLRGVFERLGAGVQFAAATKTITAVRGATTVTLRLGDPNAFVNGSARPLAVLPQVLGGTTLVPLRFVSEALGARVAWRRELRTVAITTGAPTANELPMPPGTGPVLGTVTGLFPESGSLTLRVPGGANNRVPLEAGALLLVKGSDDGSETSQPLATLQPGDQITITRDDKGRGSVLRVRTDQRRGPLKSVAPGPDGGTTVTLTDGSVVEVVSGAPVTMSGRSLAIGEIQNDETLIIRLDSTKRGVGIAVATDDDPNPVPPIKIEIAQITQNSGGRTLRAGDTLAVTITGTPGVRATFSVPGASEIESVALTESAPGVYTGETTIPKDITVQQARVQAALFQGDFRTPAAFAEGSFNIDAAPPALESTSPEANSKTTNTRSAIYGTYTDPGSGIDPKATRIELDGRDVTAQSQITDSFFSFKPVADLPLGKNTVVVAAKDTAGNQVRREWTFTVTAPTNPITSLSVTPDDEPLLGAGATLTVRIQASPGGIAKFRIGGAVADQPMPEQAPGIYIGGYTVKPGDSASRVPITVLFRPATGPAISQVSGARVTLAAGAPETPIIDRPQSGASVGPTVTITGRAAPGAMVRLKLVYQGKVVVIATQGILFDADVKTGPDGKWSTGAVELSVPGSVAGVTFIATAAVADSTGKLSGTAAVKFKK
ncbi:MAG: hypothetical protein H7Z41_05680 [Cytophagales bacterium]|nr:hypothetical protein [Armatimonadota bacterium]